MTTGRLEFRFPVFVDASAWLATTNGRDQHHEAAQATLVTCFRQRIKLVTTNWTAYEALSMVKSRVGVSGTQRLWTVLTNPEWVDFVVVSQELESRALDLFWGYRDKTWGIVDCASLVVMEDLGCHHAFGFDHHFVEASRQRGFELIPTDI